MREPYATPSHAGLGDSRVGNMHPSFLWLDRRHFSRYQLQRGDELTVDISPLGMKPRRALIIDISRGGLSAHIDYPVRQGQECLVQFHAGGESKVEPRMTLAKVVRRTEVSGRTGNIVALSFWHPLERLDLVAERQAL